jgi:hypothetical protein
LDDLRNKHVLGKSKWVVDSIEFQKRGLPHAHIVLAFDEGSEIQGIDDIDELVCCEIPSPEEDLTLHDLVKTTMIHGPCGKDLTKSSCLKKDGKCSKFFPKDFQNVTFIN